jgi:hypothetical protein
MHDVFAPGNLVRIKDYEFEDGTKRDKYMFVLYANDAEAYLISSLTTSRNKFDVTATKSGCYFHSRLSTYYHFPAGEVIGDENYAFDLDTYVLFKDNVRKIDIPSLTHYIESGDPFAVVRITTLKSDELRKMLQCIAHSTFVPVGLKAELIAYRDSL